MARAIIRDSADYYPIYAEREFKYNGIKQGNRNALLYTDNTVDGLKTGHAGAGSTLFRIARQRKISRHFRFGAGEYRNEQIREPLFAGQFRQRLRTLGLRRIPRRQHPVDMNRRRPFDSTADLLSQKGRGLIG